MSEITDKIKNSISNALINCYNYQDDSNLIMLEMPKDKSNGDYSTNIAMRLAKQFKQSPISIANTLLAQLQNEDYLKSVEVAGSGFINFFVKSDNLTSIINTIINDGDNYGSNNAGNNQKILVEFVSANPTGPLHCGHARGAAYGDAICRLLSKSGFDCLREYYINDAGHQIEMLGESIYARYQQLYGITATMPEDGYHGEDVIEITKEIAQEIKDSYLTVDKQEAIAYFAQKGKMLELERIKKDLNYFKVSFDSWVSEKWIVENHRVDDCLKKMIDSGLTYQQDGAFWFKSSTYGDDKDRVLKKSDGFYTYLTPDIANHMYKIERGYTKLIDLWGADHHGYIPRMKAALTALGNDPNILEVDLIQMVRLIENGQEVKMSKRTGNAITIRELVDEVGVDAARYFFVSRAVDTHLDFDLTLAKNQSSDNPVFYVQYAYARICSILRQANDISQCSSYDLLTTEKESELLKQLITFPNVVSDSALTRSPHKICNYVQKLAQSFHSFYANCKVIDETNPELTQQRLALLQATKITLRNALDLIGVSAPEKM